MNLKAKKWLVGLCIGACIAVGAYRWAYPRYFSPTVQLARKFNVDPLDMAFLDDISGKHDQNIKLTDAEINHIRELMDSPDTHTRGGAILAYYGAYRKGEVAKDFGAIRAKLSDPNWEPRLFALNSLWLLADPQAPDFARKMLSDPDKNVRHLAKVILDPKLKLPPMALKR